jgi:hypothetical protein
LLCGRPSFEASTFARTKAALAAAKTKGVTKDGRPLVLGRTGIEILAPKYRAEAKARAEQIAPVIRDLQQRGYSMRGIAVELDNCKVETPPAACSRRRSAAWPSASHPYNKYPSGNAAGQ